MKEMKQWGTDVGAEKKTTGIFFNKTYFAEAVVVVVVVVVVGQVTSRCC